ncbi:DUF6119 family protein [Corynebacterium sp. p3-SID1241]|uniref:DUF6119 family protein n=1 Tax=Corynebacterium sp. p3-SID1241 TaxID=2916102 RepID=UPI0021A30A9B|nr:DUF6119 family protein [Corynebacterium sp. p3-SID1241]MCT1428009.1 TIGR04141 family sporadically distributed protein [Corynebacterium sp. p3-SID1241]
MSDKIPMSVFLMHAERQKPKRTASRTESENLGIDFYSLFNKKRIHEKCKQWPLLEPGRSLDVLDPYFDSTQPPESPRRTFVFYGDIKVDKAPKWALGLQEYANSARRNRISTKRTRPVGFLLLEAKFTSSKKEEPFAWAICFGNASQFLKKGLIVKNFGRDLTSQMLEENNIVSISTSSLSLHPRNTRITYPNAANVWDYKVGTIADQVRSFSGNIELISGKEYQRVSGSNQLRLSSQLSESELAQFIHALENIKGNDKRVDNPTLTSWLNRFSRVDESEVPALNVEFAQAIAPSINNASTTAKNNEDEPDSPTREKVLLDFPFEADGILHENIRFKFQSPTDPTTSRLDENNQSTKSNLTIEDCFEHIDKRITGINWENFETDSAELEAEREDEAGNLLSQLRQERIQLIDDNDELIRSIPLLDFMSFEANVHPHGNSPQKRILHNGEWFTINADFLAEIDSMLAESYVPFDEIFSQLDSKEVAGIKWEYSDPTSDTSQKNDTSQSSSEEKQSKHIKKDEGYFNSQLDAEFNAEFDKFSLLLDKKTIGGIINNDDPAQNTDLLSSDQFEPADLILKDGTFIHTKHFSRSPAISHLCAQALHSTTMLLHDQSAQENFITKVEEEESKAANKPPSHTPATDSAASVDEYTNEDEPRAEHNVKFIRGNRIKISRVCLIIGLKESNFNDGGIPKLPLLSALSLLNLLTRLRAEGLELKVTTFLIAPRS